MPTALGRERKASETQMTAVQLRLLVLGIALCLLSSVPCRTAGQIPLARREAMMTTIVDVDGLAMRIRIAGLDDRSPHQAAVIFESGGGAPLETWDPILAGVAKFAPVVAYDRAGTG